MPAEREGCMPQVKQRKSKLQMMRRFRSLALYYPCHKEGTIELQYLVYTAGWSRCSERWRSMQQSMLLALPMPPEAAERLWTTTSLHIRWDIEPRHSADQQPVFKLTAQISQHESGHPVGPAGHCCFLVSASKGLMSGSLQPFIAPGPYVTMSDLPDIVALVPIRRINRISII